MRTLLAVAPLVFQDATMLDVVESHAASLECEVEAIHEVRVALANTPVGLLGGYEMPAEDAEGFAEGLIFLGGFVVSEEAGVLAVHASYAMQDAVHRPVAAGELEGLALRHALLVEVELVLERVEARQLATSLRTLQRTSLPSVTVRAVEGGALLLRGPASGVAGMARLLRRLDAEEPPEGEPPAWDALFPELDEGMTIAADESLLAVVEGYAELAGRRVRVAQRVRWELEETPTGLFTDAPVRPEAVHSFVEGLLSHHGFVFDVVETGGDPTFGLHRSGGVPFVPRPVFVEGAESQTRRFLDHPATLFAAVVTPRAKDARQATTSMRVLLTDTSTSALLAVGANDVYVVAPGAQLGSMVGLLCREPAATRVVIPSAPPRKLERRSDGRPHTLLDALEAYAGPNVCVTPASRAVLERTPATVDGQPVTEVTREVVERMLVQADATTTVLSDAMPDQLIGLRIGERRFGSGHRLVTLEQLDEAGWFPSLLVGVVLPLEQLEPRRAATRLRAMLERPGRDQLIAVDGGVYLAGTLADVRERVERIRAYDAAGEIPDRRGR